MLTTKPSIILLACNNNDRESILLYLCVIALVVVRLKIM